MEQYSWHCPLFCYTTEHFWIKSQQSKIIMSNIAGLNYYGHEYHGLYCYVLWA